MESRRCTNLEDGSPEPTSLGHLGIRRAFFLWREFVLLSLLYEALGPRERLSVGMLGLSVSVYGTVGLLLWGWFLWGDFGALWVLVMDVKAGDGRLLTIEV